VPYTILKLPPGVVRGATDSQAQNSWYDTNLVRWREGVLTPIGGWARIGDSGVLTKARAIAAWTDNTDQRLVAFGCDSHIHVLEGPVLRNITPDEFTNFTDDTTGGGYGALAYGVDYDPTPDTTYAISSIGRASNVVTVNTTLPHNLQPGMLVEIASVSDATFNGRFNVVAAVDADTFTYSQTGSNVTSAALGGTYQDIIAYGTRRSGGSTIYTRAFNFSLDTFGQTLVGVASTDGRLLKWSPGEAKATAVTNAPTGNRACVVTDERHIMLLGADGNPRRIAWCSREDFTDWNFSSITNTAGFLDLDTPGHLLAARNVKDGILLFTDSEVWLARYVGMPFVYAAERVGFNTTLISSQAIAAFGNKAVWMGQESFWLYDGGFVKPLPCNVGDFVFDGIERDIAGTRVTCSVNGIFPEVWFFYPENGNTENSRYIIWNYAEGWWAIGDGVKRTAMTPAGVFPYPIATDEDGVIFRHEEGWLGDGSSLVGEIYAETAAVSVGAGDQVVSISRVQPDSGFGYDKTSFTFYGRYAKEGSETTFGPYNCRAGGYMDTRVSGRDIRLRLEARETGDWSVGDFRMQVIPRGKR